MQPGALKNFPQKPVTALKCKEYTFANLKFQLLSKAHLSTIGLVFCGLASTLTYLKVHRLGDLRSHIPEFLFCYFSASVFYLLSSYVSTQATDNRTVLGTILSFACIFRFILFLSSPSLSDDVFRYAWEGYLQKQGINPYSFPPNATELDPYRNELWGLVNNREVSAIYPPLSQIVNALIYFLFQSVWGFKACFLILDGLVMYGLLKLLKLHGNRLCNVIYYAWSPLVIVEIAGSGHHDVLVVGMLLWSAIFCLSNRPRRSILFLAASVLSKLYPILMIPFFLKKTHFRHWFWFPLPIILAYLPFIKAGRNMFSALLYYRDKWRFNGFLYEQMAATLSSEVLAEKLIMLLMALLIIAILLGTKDLLKQLYWMTGAILLFAPTLFPWYLVWIVPYFCFFPSPAWLLFSITSANSYYVLIDWWTLGSWQQDSFFTALEYYPFVILLALTFIKKLYLLTRTRSTFRFR
jgi:alpha-1,6-mannosyltransferase